MTYQMSGVSAITSPGPSVCVAFASCKTAWLACSPWNAIFGLTTAALVSLWRWERKAVKTEGGWGGARPNRSEAGAHLALGGERRDGTGAAVRRCGVERRGQSRTTWRRS